MYLSSLTTVTAAASPVSIALSNAQIWSFLFEVMDNYASTQTRSALILATKPLLCIGGLAAGQAVFAC